MPRLAPCTGAGCGVENEAPAPLIRSGRLRVARGVARTRRLVQSTRTDALPLDPNRTFPCRTRWPFVLITSRRRRPTRRCRRCEQQLPRSGNDPGAATRHSKLASVDRLGLTPSHIGTRRNQGTLSPACCAPCPRPGSNVQREATSGRLEGLGNVWSFLGIAADVCLTSQASMDARADVMKPLDDGTCVH